MYRNIYDSHAHYDDPRFETDRDVLLAGLPAQGIVGVMNAASDLATARAACALSERYPFMHFSAGVHPHEAGAAGQGYLSEIEELLRHPKAVALGEIGLDYYYDLSPRETQLTVFEAQLALAVQLDVPVVIHSRDAHAPTLELLQKYRPRGVVHCFSGSAELAQEIVKLGMYLGFTGVVTFSNARRSLEAAAVVPQDRLLIETDCPYMAPQPYRGKRCDSTMLPHTAAALAQAQGVEPQTLLDYTCKNARELFAL